MKSKALVAAVIGGLLAAGAQVEPAAAETTLCKATQEGLCSEANKYPAGTELKGNLISGTEGTITTYPPEWELPSFQCRKTSLSGQTETNTTPQGKLSLINFGECSIIVETVEPGTLTVHWDAQHNANLSLAGVRIRLRHEFNSCDYGGEVTEGLTLTGGNPARIDMTVTLELVGITGAFGCYETIVAHAELEVTSPKPLYVSSGI